MSVELSIKSDSSIRHFLDLLFTEPGFLLKKSPVPTWLFEDCERIQNDLTKELATKWIFDSESRTQLGQRLALLKFHSQAPKKAQGFHLHLAAETLGQVQMWETCRLTSYKILKKGDGHIIEFIKVPSVTLGCYVPKKAQQEYFDDEYTSVFQVPVLKDSPHIKEFKNLVDSGAISGHNREYNKERTTDLVLNMLLNPDSSEPVLKCQALHRCYGSSFVLGFDLDFEDPDNPLVMYYESLGFLESKRFLKGETLFIINKEDYLQTLFEKQRKHALKQFCLKNGF